MSYRKNVSDKEQGDIERAADHSAIRFAWFDGKAIQTGMMKAIPALSLLGRWRSGMTSAMRAIPGSGSVIGSHNDKPFQFETPGKP